MHFHDKDGKLLRWPSGKVVHAPVSVTMYTGEKTMTLYDTNIFYPMAKATLEHVQATPGSTCCYRFFGTDDQWVAFKEAVVKRVLTCVV